jgi:hypothetical protein
MLMGSPDYKDGTVNKTTGSIQLVPAHTCYDRSYFLKLCYHKILQDHKWSGANTATISEVNMITTVVLLMESKV